MADAAHNSFSDITGRLDEIISVVRSKDTSLERSLDLYDEAIELGARAVELVDSFDMSPEEAAQLEEAAQGDATSGDGSQPTNTSASGNADATAPASSMQSS